MANLCSNCNNKLATYRVNGRIKSDNQHDLCNKCFNSIKNSMQILLNNTKSISWEKRSTAFDHLIKERSVIVRTENSDLIDASKFCKITIGSGRTITRFFENEVEIDRFVPDMIYSWNDKTLKYIKHWLSKVLDDSILKDNNRIIITMP